MTETKPLDGWGYMVRAELEKEARKKEANPGPELRPHEILVHGHEIPLDKTVKKNSTVGKVAWFAVEHGWSVKVGEATFRKPDHLRNGEVVKGAEVSWRWTQGISPDRLHHFSVSTELLLYDGWPVDSVAEVKVGISEHGDSALVLE
jgi:hypothetical protein